MSDMPKYVLKNKRLSKTKTVFIFRRNYLDVNEFRKTDSGWVFEEEFRYYGSECYFRMTVRDDNIFTMYDVDCKSAKVKGKKNCFGIFFRTSKQKSTFNITHRCENVEFVLSCKGSQIAFDNGKGLKKTKEERIMKEFVVTQQGSKKAIEVPKSVAWNMSHPLQGGGVSPR